MEKRINLFGHDHPLTPSSGFAFRCNRCKAGGYISNGYHCIECDLWFHKDCGKSLKINHTSHPEHHLILTFAANWDLRWCNVCGRFIDDNWAYRCYKCSIGDFSLHISCAREPPPLTIKHPQSHEHPLMLFPVSRNLEHLCEVCKEKVVGKLAYRCFKCEVVIHVKCVNSPEVNHPCHPKHSLKLLTSETPDYSDNKCLLCGLELEGVLYHCSICNFSVCLGCASIPPPVEFEHRKTHEHKLTIMARQISFTCNACGMQGNRSPYFCLQCDFMVHRSCIGLPHVIKINLHDHWISHIQQLEFGNWVCRVCLQSVNRFYVGDMDSPKVLPCSACGEFFNGFRYDSNHVVLDVGCILISELFSHENHEHPLHYNKTYIGKCDACHGSVESGGFSCESCGYNLDFHCASLPKTVKNVCDQHPLSLSGKENVSGKYWCDICEGEMDQNKWFYTCNDCGVSLHVKCVLGDFYRLKPGRVVELREQIFVVIQNNHSSRPICSGCGLRCKAPVVLKACGLDMFVCSKGCFYVYLTIVKAAWLFMDKGREGLKLDHVTS